MLISTMRQEFPNCPFIFDRLDFTQYPSLYNTKINSTTNSKFIEIIKRFLNVDEFENVDFFVNIQMINKVQKKKEIQIAFHTWIIKTLNPNISFLPADVTVSSNFEAGLFPIYATLKEAHEGNIQVVKTCESYKMIRQGIGIGKTSFEYARIETIDKKVNMSPSNSCNFVFEHEDYPVNSFLSVIKNPTIYVAETKEYIEHQKNINQCAITLHIVIDEKSLGEIKRITKYINDTYSLNVIL